MTNKKLVAALLLSTLTLSSCAAPFIAAGAVGGTAGAASAREGGIKQTVSDVKISSNLHDAWFTYNRDMFDKLYATVFEGRVMIVGSVQQAEYRDSAIRLAWQVTGVRQVINEIRVEPSNGVGAYTKDAWIGTQLRTRLLTDGEITSGNFKFECNNGVLYLIGVARDQEELNRVINHARNIAYVRDVVSYVRLAGTQRPNEGNSANIQNSPPAGVTQAPAPVSSSSTAPAPVSQAAGYPSSNASVADSDNAVGSSYTPPPGAADISSTDLAPVK